MVLARGDIDQYPLGTAIEHALGLADPGDADAPRTDDGIRLGTVLLWLALAGGGFTLLLVRTRGLPARTFTALALALVAVDLLRAGMGYNPAIPVDETEQPVTPALERLVERRPARFAGVGDVPQNIIGMRLQIPDARGYDLPIMKRYSRLWRREVLHRSSPT